MSKDLDKFVLILFICTIIVLRRQQLSEVGLVCWVVSSWATTLACKQILWFKLGFRLA